MDKVLVSLYVPAVDRQYEVLVPVFLKIGDLIPLFTEALSEMTQQQFVPSSDVLLCWIDKDIVLNKTRTLSEYGIQNGECLYLY